MDTKVLPDISRQFQHPKKVYEGRGPYKTKHIGTDKLTMHRTKQTRRSLSNAAGWNLKKKTKKKKNNNNNKKQQQKKQAKDIDTNQPFFNQLLIVKI